jgi:hypothetical protein
MEDEQEHEEIIEEEESFDEGPELEPDKGHDLDLTPMVQSEDRSLAPYDPLQLYLLEIKRYKLLTKEEEVERHIALLHPI